MVLGGIGAGMLLYGVAIEAHDLILERRRLKLKGWPESKRGYRIAVLADMHLNGASAVARGHRAVKMALEAEPDMVVIPGDVIDHWTRRVVDDVRSVLAPLSAMNGKVVAVPGNHDYRNTEITWMRPLLDELGITLLRNASEVIDGVRWVGVDSAVEDHARPDLAMLDLPDEYPAVAIWHEADLVSMLPPGCVLQISGHSHGGQFRFPGGFTPMHSYLGQIYPRGFYPEAKTPLYVSRGVGTTAYPTRFLCRPEVSLLILEPTDVA